MNEIKTTSIINPAEGEKGEKVQKRKMPTKRPFRESQNFAP